MAIVALLLVTFIAASCAGSKTQSEDAFPTKTVTLIVPFAAGGGTDLVARKLAPILSDELGVRVLTVNKPGGSTVPALNELRKDDSGYTVVIEGPVLVGMKPMGASNLGPDDFAAVALVQSDSPEIAVSTNSKWTSIDDFIDAAKANPGELQVSTSAAGGVYDAGARQLKKDGLPIEPVPFNEGTAPAIVALLGGRVDANIASPAEIKKYLDSGDMRMLAVGTDKRLKQYPDVPTFKEAGLTQGEATKVFRVAITNKNVDPSKLKTLEKAFVKAAESKKFNDFLKKNNYEQMVLGRKEATKFLEKQSAIYQNIYG